MSQNMWSRIAAAAAAGSMLSVVGLAATEAPAATSTEASAQFTAATTGVAIVSHADYTDPGANEPPVCC